MGISRLEERILYRARSTASEGGPMSPLGEVYRSEGECEHDRVETA